MSFVTGGGDQCLQPLFGRRVMADLQAVQVQGLAQAFYLRLGHLHFGTAQLREIFRRDDAGQQPQHHQHHQQFKQCEPALGSRGKSTRGETQTLFHVDLTQSAEGSRYTLMQLPCKAPLKPTTSSCSPRIPATRAFGTVLAYG
ncbi:hypothetical protein D3C72_1527530 [compost metagenome]